MFEGFEGTEEWNAGYRLQPVIVSTQPQFNPRTEKLEANAVPHFEDGTLFLGWTTISLTSQELAEAESEQASIVRSARNSVLSACDWTQVADAPVDKIAWATYRQALRDLPSQPGFPWSVTWPTEPQ